VLDRDLKPAFEGKTVDEITKKDVTTALDAIGERSGSAANKTHKWGRQLFNWLIDQGEMEHSPMAKVKKPFPESERTRVLSLAEVVVVWVALDSIAEPFRSFYRLAILLGQRLRENANAPWAEFDFEAEEWLLPEERTKAKRDHLVPLSKQAIDILVSIKPDQATRVGIVFTTNGVSGISGFSKMKDALDEAVVKLIEGDSRARALVGDAIAPWVVHDLRRSIVTTGQAMGFQLEHTEAVLNHAIGKRSTTSTTSTTRRRR
jgi:integrase